VFRKNGCHSWQAWKKIYDIKRKLDTGSYYLYIDKLIRSPLFDGTPEIALRVASGGFQNKGRPVFDARYFCRLM
jgi:hypothetical protein